MYALPSFPELWNFGRGCKPALAQDQQEVCLAEKEQSCSPVSCSLFWRCSGHGTSLVLTPWGQVFNTVQFTGFSLNKNRTEVHATLINNGYIMFQRRQVVWGLAFSRDERLTRLLSDTGAMKCVQTDCPDSGSQYLLPLRCQLAARFSVDPGGWNVYGFLQMYHAFC